MSLTQFRILYRLLTGQMESEEFWRGYLFSTRRALRNRGWIRWGPRLRCVEVTDEGLAEMRRTFPEFFDDHEEVFEPPSPLEVKE